MKKLLLALAVLLLALALPGTMAGASVSEPRDFRADMTGNEEVPPVKTEGSGEFTLQISEDGMSITYQLSVEDLTSNILQAHIHLGQRGANGPVVAFLFDARPNGVPGDSLEVEGVITAAKLVGPLQGHKLSDLIAAIRNGNAYANVHTKINQGGEVRGQIVSEEFDEEAVG
jgi:hypothetical protein